MSLINKMLQDLDARGSGAAASQGGSSAVRPVTAAVRPMPRTLLILAAVAGVVIFVVAAIFAWRALTRPSPSSLSASAKAAASASAATPAASIAPMPAAEPAPVAAAMLAPAAAASAPASVTPPSAPIGAQVQATEPAPKQVAAAPSQDAKPASVSATPAEPPVKARSAEKRRTEPALRTSPAPARSPIAEKEEARLRGDAGLNKAQQAENEYRRGLSAMQEGRVHDAIARFEQTLANNPRHEAARQTLVGLLIENQRGDEAMQHMQQALALDPGQAQMAMLLARLQMERNGPAIDTLQRTLPHAAANADFRAFLAGALQREQRHAEAAEHYQAALRLQAGNSVWWMGLGISLQALKRNAEARAAFNEAKASGRLSPELQTFVERKLQQLPN
ncbi:tetratricopeptide repeat protein [Massilia sp. BJB1822]|uniref:tetratricopeptide repeat protein n=1 Tax=Massilia sp. BJB1822 TaxID=2744470 RepID=UPI0015938AA9|nr:tetratricopeptide repeat protein [Massilia sp. BJB1822]NVD97522.1 tetratricopeptide repeat protein [Massilia sp. BJB1822]